MRAMVRTWNDEHFEGDLVEFQLNINGMSINSEDVKFIRFDGYDRTRYIGGVLVLKDTTLQFRLRKKGWFSKRWEGNIEGHLDLNIKSLQVTKRFRIWELEEASWTDE